MDIPERELDDLHRVFPRISATGGKHWPTATTYASDFRRRFDVMSVQRNLKALGTFGYQAKMRRNAWPTCSTCRGRCAMRAPTSLEISPVSRGCERSWPRTSKNFDKVQWMFRPVAKRQFGVSTRLFHGQRLCRDHLLAIAAHGFETVELVRHLVAFRLSQRERKVADLQAVRSPPRPGSSCTAFTRRSASVTKVDAGSDRCRSPVSTRTSERGQWTPPNRRSISHAGFQFRCSSCILVRRGGQEPDGMPATPVALTAGLLRDGASRRSRGQPAHSGSRWPSR